MQITKITAASLDAHQKARKGYEGDIISPVGGKWESLLPNGTDYIWLPAGLLQPGYYSLTADQILAATGIDVSELCDQWNVEAGDF